MPLMRYVNGMHTCICSMPFFCAVVNADDAQSVTYLAANRGRSETGFRCREVLNVFKQCVILGTKSFQVLMCY